MPRNGSGTYVLPEAAFVPNTPISSSAVNSDFSDVASALTGSIAADGQTVITGRLKGASGTVGLPSYAFSADPDTGGYRVAANTYGISAGGTKIIQVDTTGLAVTGTVAPSTTVTNANGTVLLPSYTFAGDLNSGFYWIGADNIGAAVNGAKVLDISTSGLNVIGTVSSNGAAFAPLPQAVGMVNGTIVATANSPGASAITFALKTLAGADPSATDIVYVIFRNVTAATGNYTVIQVTAALSLTVTNGSLLGTSNNVPFKLWFSIFNDGGTPRIGVINNVSGSNIYPLGQFPIASSTAEGGAGGADSAQVFYTDTAVTSKAYVPIGYASYESGLATAGSWTAAPTRIELYKASSPLPGQTIQTKYASTTSNTTNQTNAYVSTGVTVDISPTSAANLVKASATGTLGSNGSTDNPTIAIHRGATLVGIEIKASPSNNATWNCPSALLVIDAPGTTSSTTYVVKLNNHGTSNISNFPTTSGGNIYVEEIMT